MSEVTLIVQKPDSAVIQFVADQGPPGPASNLDDFTPADIGALAITARLAEFTTEQARIDARTNMGVQVIDAGTF